MPLQLRHDLLVRGLHLGQAALARFLRAGVQLGPRAAPTARMVAIPQPQGHTRPRPVLSTSPLWSWAPPTTPAPALRIYKPHPVTLFPVLQGLLSHGVKSLLLCLTLVASGQAFPQGTPVRRNPLWHGHSSEFWLRLSPLPGTFFCNFLFQGNGLGLQSSLMSSLLYLWTASALAPPDYTFSKDKEDLIQLGAPQGPDQSLTGDRC